MSDTGERLAVLEQQFSMLCETIPTRLDAIEAVVLDIRLTLARREWQQRVLWLCIGVVVPLTLAYCAKLLTRAVATASAP